MAEALVKTRGVIKSKMTRIAQYVDKFSQKDINEITVREISLKETFQSYEQTQLSLEEISEEIYGPDRETTEAKYLSTLA